MRLPDAEPAEVRRVLTDIENTLDGLGTLKIPQLNNGLFAAVGQADLKGASGYQHAWLRDNVMVAYSRWHCHEVESAITAVKSLETFLMSQVDRMEKLILRPEGKETVQNRPHVRFQATTLKPIKAPWSHAQNDALGDVVWLRLLLAEKENLSLTADEMELLGTLVRYFAAIEYWKDRDSGPWEEERKINSSSVGTVLAALRAVRRYKRRDKAWFKMFSERDLNSW